MIQKSKTIFPKSIKIALREKEKKFLNQVRKEDQITVSEFVRDLIDEKMKIREQIQ